MRRIEKIFIAITCALLLSSKFLSAQEKVEVKIGALLSLSGGLEQWCQYIREGIELAASEESAVKVNIIFEDDHSVDRKATVSAAQKLIQVDKVDLLYSWTASTVPVLVPIANNARIPLLIGAYDQNVEKGGAYVFGAFVNYDLVPREIARFYVQKKAVKRLGLILMADDWSQNFLGPFVDEAKKLGAEVVLTETISSSEKDFRALILRLKKENVEAVLSPLYGISLYSFLKQARELHYSGLIHVGDGMFEEDLKNAGPSSEGVFASQIWLESSKLSTLLKKRYGHESNALQLGMVASGYDWVKHIQEAAEQILHEGKAVSRESILSALKTFKSQGYLGEQMYGSAPSQGGEIIMVVENGRYVPAK